MVPLEQLSVFRANIPLRKSRQIADRPPTDFDFAGPSGCGETERSILRAFPPPLLRQGQRNTQGWIKARGDVGLVRGRQVVDG